MSGTRSPLLKFILVVSFLTPLVTSCGKTESMLESAVGPAVLNEAPPEAITAFRDLMAYVRKEEPSIVTDEAAQARWLSKGMRSDFTQHFQRAGSPQENPDYPRNSTFTGVWNQPTTFSIVGTRHYDHRDRDNPNDNRAVLDVLYEWDTRTDGLDNQYPGEKSLRSFVFVFEDGAWKLDDIYTFDDEYASPESLRSYLRDTSR